MEYYSAMNELMPFAATYMDLGIILLSEASHTEKDKYHMISLIGGSLRKQRSQAGGRAALRTSKR